MSKADLEYEEDPTESPIDVMGPSDEVKQVPFGLVLDDQFRRQNISNTAYKFVTKYDEDGKPLETVMEMAEPNLAAIYAHALSPQNNLMDFSPTMALAKKIENDVLFQTIQLKYRRTKHRGNLTVAQVVLNQTIDGMSTEGTFPLWMTKMTGSTREMITGVRGEHK